MHTRRFWFVTLLAGILASLLPPIAWGQSQWVPIAPYIYKYHQSVFDKLIGEQIPEAWMIVRPSFRKEYAVLILRSYQEGVPADHSLYRVELAVAHTSIWNAFSKPRFRSATVLVDRNSAQISYSNVSDLVDHWSEALKTVTYSDKDPSGLDGTDYEFYAKNRYGATWSPDDGTALSMVKNGECLVQFVKATIPNRDGILAECLKTARTLTPSLVE